MLAHLHADSLMLIAIQLRSVTAVRLGLTIPTPTVAFWRKCLLRCYDSVANRNGSIRGFSALTSASDEGTVPLSR